MRCFTTLKPSPRAILSDPEALCYAAMEGLDVAHEAKSCRKQAGGGSFLWLLTFEQEKVSNSPRGERESFIRCTASEHALRALPLLFTL